MMEKLTEICDGVFRIIQKPRFSSVLPPANIYVLTGRNGLIFDAGYGTRKSVMSLVGYIKKIERIMKERNRPCQLTRILPSHSHPDHFSGLIPLKKETGIKILLTPKMIRNLSSETDYYRYNVDIDVSLRFWRAHVIKFVHRHAFGAYFIQKTDDIVNEEDRIVIDKEIWHILQSPGHCDDHISLYNDRQGVLLAGDNVLQSITTWLGPPRSDISAYCQTLKAYLDLPKLEVIHAAHGIPVLNPKNRILELLNHRNERTHEILCIIRKFHGKGVSMRDIVNNIYTGKEMFKRPIAYGWVRLTLKGLEADHLIEKRQSGSKVRYFPCG